MAEDPQPMTLQQRIAALNAAHIGRVPGDPPLPIIRPKPEVPMRPPIIRPNTANIPYEQVNGSVTQIKVGNQPNVVPPPLPNRKQAPPLPDRKSSDDSSRQTSVTSVTSVSTTGTNGSRALATRTKSEDQGPRIKAPAWGEGELPALPEKRAQTQIRPGVPQRPVYKSRTSQSSLSSRRSVSGQSFAAKPTQPPPLPTRKASVDSQSTISDLHARRLPPVHSSASLEQVRKAAFNLKTAEPEPELEPARPALPTRPQPSNQLAIEAPPIPLASRPDLSAIQATKPRPATIQNFDAYAQQPVVQTNECMICRDFSSPDQRATLFPRQQVTSLQQLAQQLTSPFPSPTDKARAIFTWLHHNIAYDVVSFFSGNLKGSTPQSTLQSGLAVCEGYASLFANLATYAGLEAVVVSGHGKGYGHMNLEPGQPLPPFDSNHAWNAVKIDHGEWKLIDPCWGAGHVQGVNQPYVQMFHPQQFTMTNEQFGIKHFPSNKDQFFLPGGARMSWEDYVLTNPETWPYHCEQPTVFSNGKDDYGIGETTVLPRERDIKVNQNKTIRFQFGLPCPHWTLEKHTKKGPPPLFLLAIHGLDGRSKDHVPFEYIKGTRPGGGGDLWYVDVPSRDLGAPGQKLMLYAITQFGNRQDARGLTVQEFRQGKGRVAMYFSGVASWDLV